MNQIVDVFAVGPQRTASSWLDRALRAQPHLCLPTNVKETFFFDCYYDRGWQWYFSHFGDSPEGTLLAEVGSTYFESAEAKERIRTMNSKALIIIMVRNPITRSFSSFRHEYTKGRTSGHFFEAIATSPRIVDAGRYSVLAPGWEESFGRAQVCYLVQEDIEADPERELDNIFNFLGLKSIQLPDELQERYGQGTVPRFQLLATAASRITSALRRKGLHRIVEMGKRLGLKRVYSGGDRKGMAMTRSIFNYLLSEHEADIKFLEERLGRSFTHWRNPETYQLEK